MEGRGSNYIIKAMAYGCLILTSIGFLKAHRINSEYNRNYCDQQEHKLDGDLHQGFNFDGSTIKLRHAIINEDRELSDECKPNVWV